MHVENNDKKKKKKAETVAMCFGRWKELTRDCCKERERERVLGAVNEQDTETMRACWWAVRQL